MLKFDVPEGGSNLRTANFSRNQVRLMFDLSRFNHLRSLNLDNNQIEALTGAVAGCDRQSCDWVLSRAARFTPCCPPMAHVCAGLGRLPMLGSLSVAGNRLTSLQGLEHLPAIRHLNAEGNQLRSLTAISVLTTLEALHVARNNITTLTGAVLSRAQVHHATACASAECAPWPRPLPRSPEQAGAAAAAGRVGQPAAQPA